MFCFLISVALNYQTEDKQNFINRARFSDNAGCGYVLKPDFLRDNSIAYSPNSPSELDVEKYPSWKIQVKGHHVEPVQPNTNSPTQALYQQLFRHPNTFICFPKLPPCVRDSRLQTSYPNATHLLKCVLNLRSLVSYMFPVIGMRISKSSSDPTWSYHTSSTQGIDQIDMPSGVSTCTRKALQLNQIGPTGFVILLVRFVDGV